MLSNITAFLLHTVCGLFTFMLLLRFLMQATRTSFQNPLGQMTIVLTDAVVKPVRSVIKPYRQWDLSTLLLALLVQLLLTLLLALAGGMGSLPAATVLLVSVLGVATTLVDIFFYAIVLLAILSWVNPLHPLSATLESLASPVLSPLRAWIPPVGGFDLSALVALILLQMLGHIILPGLVGAWM